MAQAFGAQNQSEAAESLYLAVLKVEPDNATAHQWRAGNLCALVRLDECVREGQRAAALDPLSAVIQDNLAGAYFMSRRYSEALVTIRRMFELDPRFVDPAIVAPIYVLNGLIDSALVRLDSMERIEPHATQLFAQRVFALTAAGRWNDAEKIRADSLERGNDLTGGFEPAMIEMFLGRPEPILKYLDSATGQHQFTYSYFAVGCTPVLDPIATRGEFIAALKRYGVKQCPLTPAWPITIPPRTAAPNR